MFSTLFVLLIAILAISRPSMSENVRQRDPRVITEPQEFEAEAGASITLPCSIRYVGRRSVFWFKGEGPEGKELIMQMRFNKGQFVVPNQYQEIIDSGKLETEGSDLIIHNLRTSDSSSYTCSIAWARQSVTHTLNVIGGAAPLPVTAVPSDGQVKVGEGLPAILSCVATWDPPATISWFREGEPDVFGVGSTYNIFTTNRDDSGRYYCKAENGVDEPVTFNFDVAVGYVEVEADVVEVVASGEDQMAQLSCRIRGFPEPQIAWYTTAGPVDQDSRHRVYSQDNVHYLQLQQMTPADLGEYQCYGYNEKSRDHATIKVTASPGPVTITGEGYGGGGTYYLDWQVNSLVPIKFYHVALREVSSDSVESISVPGSSRPSDGRRLYRADHGFDITPGQTYEVMIKAVGEEYQPGPDQEKPYTFSVPNLYPGANDAVRLIRPQPPTYTSQVSTNTDREATPANQESTYSSIGSRGNTTYGGQGSPESTHGEAGSTYANQDEDYYDYSDNTKVEVGDKDAWKWFKIVMTVVSRLPQIFRNAD